MAIKGKLKQKTGSNTSEILHPETDASVVTYSGSVSGATNVKDALDTLAVGTGVTGVKGDAETTYRSGNVNITPANIGAIPTSAKGAANGVATLDENGMVPSTQLPSYVDDVLTVQGAAVTGHIFNIDVPHSELIECESESELTGITTLSQLNAKFGTNLGVSGGSGAFFVRVRDSSAQYASYNTKLFRFIYEGNTIRNQSVVSTSNLFETGKIYIDEDTNKTYRYYISSLIEISKSLAIGETASSAFAGNRGKALEEAMPNKIETVLKDIGTATFNGSTSSSTTVSTSLTSDEISKFKAGKLLLVLGVALNGTKRFCLFVYGETSSGKAISNYVTTGFNDYVGPWTLYLKAIYLEVDESTGEITVKTGTTGFNSIPISFGAPSSSGGVALATTNCVYQAVSTKADSASPTAGTYSAVSVNAQGIVTAGGQVLEVIENGATPTVANGGWFFEKDA